LLLLLAAAVLDRGEGQGDRAIKVFVIILVISLDCVASLAMTVQNNPQRYPQRIAAKQLCTLLLASRGGRRMFAHRSLAFGSPDERDRHGQIGLVLKPLPGVAPCVGQNVVPAAGSSAENVTGGSAQTCPP
jgi:hypothetical protein